MSILTVTFQPQPSVHLPLYVVKDSFSQRFRDETRRTTAKLEHREGCRQTSSDNLSGMPQNLARAEFIITESQDQALSNETHDSSNATGKFSRGKKNTIAQHLSPPLYDVLETFFFGQIVCSDAGWSAHLRPLYLNHARPGYLDSSVKAAALFALGNQHHDPSMVDQARTTYSDALTALNLALGDEKERLKDEVLCTVLVLNLIEVHHL